MQKLAFKATVRVAPTSAAWPNATSLFSSNICEYVRRVDTPRTLEWTCVQAPDLQLFGEQAIKHARIVALPAVARSRVG